MAGLKSSPFFQRPGTRLGWWAVSLAGVFILPCAFVLFLLLGELLVPH